MIDLFPLGDRAWLARFAREAEARGWGHAARAEAFPGVVDVVVAYAQVAVHFDPDRVEPVALRAALLQVSIAERLPEVGRLHHIPTLYDGPDLDEVARRLGLEVGEVIRAHALTTYDVLAVGFQPGFPYAGPLAQSLCGLVRRESPRPIVPAGSVAIVGRQTAIYPRASPGGWHLIGRTPVGICDLETGFFPIKAGDRLRFQPIDRGRFLALEGGRVGEVGDGGHTAGWVR